jgi:hypothetical protein
MDLNASPDLEALYCYGIVLLVGALVARGQVSGKLGKLPGTWIMSATWLLFFAYTIVPVALFWLLDRTGAIHDTSLFAALLVAVGYQQILTGAMNTLKAPGEVSSFWQPFTKWADRVADRVTERVQSNEGRLREQVIGKLAKDDQKLRLLQGLVLSRSLKPEEVQQEMEDVRARFKQVGDESVDENVAGFLYDRLRNLADKDAEYLMYRRGITGMGAYLWFAREWRSKTLAIIVGTLVLVGGLWLVRQLTTPEYAVHYYAWRLSKPNGTEVDRFRASRKLLALLKEETSSALVCDRLAYLLREPDLQVASIDHVLALIIERPWTGDSPTQVAAKLIDSLRAGNPDARARVHTALLHLARKSQREPMVPQALRTWNPTQGNSLTDLDQNIEEWRKVFSDQLPPSAVEPQPATPSIVPAASGDGG